MKPNGINDIRGIKWKPAALITAGLVTILLIIVAFMGNQLSGNKKTQLSQLADKLSEEKMVLQQDILLHSGFRNLQRMDENYGLLSVENAPRSRLDSAEKSILEAENSFKQVIDSIKRETGKYNTWANVVMIDSITASFSLALSNRNFINTIQRSLSGNKSGFNENDRSMIELRQELQKKDNRILLLENQIKTQPGNRPDKHPVQANARENELLRLSLSEEETRSTKLLDITNALRQDNEKLVMQLSQARKSGSSGEAGLREAKTRNATMAEQIDDLTAELNFARIDCNLTRADAKKIISNSRQRKELLAAALEALKNLSASEDPDIRSKAKTRIAELNQIASTVRD